MVINGFVIKGLGKGKKMGFPTANIDPKNAPKGLKFGVYKVIVNIPTLKTNSLLGVMHFGPRSVHDKKVSLEVHILLKKINIRRKKIQIVVKRRLRNVKKFASQSALIKQIERDIVNARKK